MLTYITENVLRATCKCECGHGCDCDEVFNKPSFDPETEEAKQHAERCVQESATYKARPAWHRHLTEMHGHFCDYKTCKGIPKLENIKDADMVDAEDCVFCCESVWILRGFTFGFYILPKNGETPPPEINENYALKTTRAMNSIGNDLKKELKAGWLRLVKWTRYTTPLFVKIEPDKDRIIKDFSKPEDDGINAFAEYHKTSYMNVRSALI